MSRPSASSCWLVGEIFSFAACGAAAVLKHNAESAFERGIMPVTSFLINRFDALVRTPEENQRDFFPVGGADDKRIKLYAIAHGHHLFFNDEVDGGLHAIAAIGCELHDKLLYFSENEGAIFVFEAIWIAVMLIHIVVIKFFPDEHFRFCGDCGDILRDQGKFIFAVASGIAGDHTVAIVSAHKVFEVDGICIEDPAQIFRMISGIIFQQPDDTLFGGAGQEIDPVHISADHAVLRPVGIGCSPPYGVFCILVQHRPSVNIGREDF